jgi:cytochrome c oxidase subunit 1
MLIASGVLLAFCGMVLLGINFIATTHTMRRKGRTWLRLPLFVWSIYTTSWILLIAAPVLMVCLVLLLVESLFGIGVFNPANGGDPLLFRKLFWFFGRPALFVMILPAIGVISELIGIQTEKNYGYRAIIYAMLAIAVLAFLTGSGHLVVSSQSFETTLLSSLFNFLSAVPFLVILFSWILTLYRRPFTYRASMLYILGFMALVTIGGGSGLFLAASGLGVHLHSTYFVLAHFHYLLAGSALTAYLGGLHSWWHELSGTEHPELGAQISAVLIFCGINMAFLPQFFLGFLGMPRRYSAYPVEFEALQVLATAGIPILAAGYLIPMVYLGWGLIRNWGFGVRDSVAVR